MLFGGNWNQANDETGSGGKCDSNQKKRQLVGSRLIEKSTGDRPDYRTECAGGECIPQHHYSFLNVIRCNKSQARGPKRGRGSTLANLPQHQKQEAGRQAKE